MKKDLKLDELAMKNVNMDQLQKIANDMMEIDSETSQINGVISSANIILAGVSGAGKSTLVNSIFGSELARTGKGAPITQEITEYTNEAMPVRIWDTIGFEIGANSEGKPKTQVAIAKIKQTIIDQSKKGMAESIHAIWYCINQGTNKYQPAEQEFVKSLHDNEIPFIIVLTQCIEDGHELRDQIELINRQNGLSDIPIVETLAAEKKMKGGFCIPAFGLTELVAITLSMLPQFVKKGFIAAQRIDCVAKRSECEKIIEKYETISDKDFWDKVPLINLATANKKITDMFKEITQMYCMVLPEGAPEKITKDMGVDWFKHAGWLLNFNYSGKQEKLKTLMEDIRKQDAQGLELKERQFSNSDRVSRMITFYGYTILLAIEETWIEYRDQEVKKIEKLVKCIHKRINDILEGKAKPKVSI